MQTNVIRGKIVEQFGTLSKFATALGWAPNKVSRIVCGKQEPTASDMKMISTALNISDPAEVVAIFLCP